MRRGEPSISARGWRCPSKSGKMDVSGGSTRDCRPAIAVVCDMESYGLFERVRRFDEVEDMLAKAPAENP